MLHAIAIILMCRNVVQVPTPAKKIKEIVILIQIVFPTYDVVNTTVIGPIHLGVLETNGKWQIAVMTQFYVSFYDVFSLGLFSLRNSS